MQFIVLLMLISGISAGSPGYNYQSSSWQLIPCDTKIHTDMANIPFGNVQQFFDGYGTIIAYWGNRSGRESVFHLVNEYLLSKKATYSDKLIVEQRAREFIIAQMNYYSEDCINKALSTMIPTSFPSEYESSSSF